MQAAAAAPVIRARIRGVNVQDNGCGISFAAARAGVLHSGAPEAGQGACFAEFKTMNRMDIASLAAGLAGLFLGGELLVRGAAGVAEKLGLPMFLIGLTVVGFDTSMPELLVSLNAALRGFPEIAIGNIVGSNISIILLILGFAALVRPIPLAQAVPSRDAVVMAAAAQVLIAPFWQGQMDRAAGAVQCAALVAYLA